MRTLPYILAAVFAVSACAEGGTGAEQQDPSPTVRAEGPVPGLPGDADVGSVEDGGASADFGCPVGACQIGMSRCEGSAVVTCVSDALRTWCGIWGAPSECVTPETCISGICETPIGCVDGDGDGYGRMCAAGDDCDDANAAVHVGAPELCDGVDNDCNGTADDGFQLGVACTYGTGNCQADGVFVCSPGGGTMCSAMTLVGDAEVCDGIDNDCNGIADDGVCGLCQGDIFEPNDVPADATLIQVDAPRWGYLCPGDTDWFDLETQTGVQYHIYVTFPEAASDLLVEGWVDGVNVITGDTSGRDYEEFIVNGDSTKSFQIQVIDRDNVESFFRVSLVANANCTNEDGFVPNQSIATAAQLPASWLTEAYMCSGYLSDWFYLGDLTQNDALYIGIIGELYGTDLDLHLWGDPDGDNVFELVRSSTNFDNVEDIDMPVPYSGPFYFEVRDFEGAGGYYDVGWALP